jgi:hypothetical protein
VASPAPLSLASAVSSYDLGKRNKLWTDPEDYLAFLDGLRSDRMSQEAFGSVFGSDHISRAVQYWTQASQYVAIATSFFVDRVRDGAALPEAWAPYTSWMSSLTEQDSILTFNYDRVVEELIKRTGRRPGHFVKLHGDVPDPDALAVKVSEGSAIETIATPGLKKVQARNEHLAAAWKEAGEVLRAAQRVIVVGYSFPATDASVTELIVKNCEAGQVTVVVGKTDTAARISTMFSRLSGRPTSNTGLLAEEFLGQGSARPQDGRFDHDFFSRF